MCVCVGERKSEEEKVEAQLKRNKKWTRERYCWKNGCVAAGDSKIRSGSSNAVEVLAAKLRVTPGLVTVIRCSKSHTEAIRGNVTRLFFFCSAVWWRVMTRNKSMSICLWKQVEVKRGLSSACDIIFGLSERHQWSFFTAAADTIFRCVLCVIWV